MRTRGKVLVAAGALVAAGLGLLAWVSTTFVIADTEEDIWPDPRDRQHVHLGILSRQLQAHARDHGGLPASLAALSADMARPQAADRLLDLWGTGLGYERARAVFTLRSAGPDREFGTADDIVYRDGTTYRSKRALAGYDTTGSDTGEADAPPT